MLMVTGANGFVGRNLVLELLSRGEEVLGVDCRPAYDPSEVESAGEKYQEAIADVNDVETMRAVFQKYRPKTVVALNEAFAGPVTDWVMRSVIALTNLLKIAHEEGVVRVLLASSLGVYVGLPGPHREDMNVGLEAPLHIAALKKAEEVAAHWFAHNTGLEVIFMRLANMYGPRYRSMMNLPSRLLFDAIKRPYEQRLEIDDTAYDQIADFSHVEDCARGIALVATAPSLRHRVYNIGSGKAATAPDMKHAVDLAVNRENNAVSNGTKPSTNRNYLSIDRISEELGYKPKYDIVSGVAAWREWLATHDN